MVLRSYLIEMLKNIQNSILNVEKSSKFNLCPMKDHKSSYSDFGPPTSSMEACGHDFFINLTPYAEG